MTRIVVVGSYGVGITVRVPRMMEAGETLRGSGFSSSPGGKGSNQAIGARRLGAEVELCSCVGPDDFGRAARALWDAEGVGHAHVREGSLPTMVGVILVEPGGENRIAIAPGALDELRPEDVAAFGDCIAEADICVVGLEIPLDPALEALRVARRVGTPTLLNPAPALPLPAEAWGLIDHLTPNRQEAAVLLGAEGSLEPEAAISALRARLPRGGSVVLTLGSRGALALPAGHERPELIAPLPVPRVVDTTGAGDAFTAALAVALAEGSSVVEAATFANRAGAHAVQHEDVVPALPYRRDLG